MAVELYRVDDRLIHGQIVVGWGHPLGLGFIVLVDDAIADSEWEQELYRMAVPPQMEVRFRTVEGAAREHASYVADRRRGMVLTGDIETMGRLAAAAPIRAINLGGIHHRGDRVQRVRYIFLAPDEERALRQLASRGIAVSAQDVPTAPPLPLDQLLGSRL